MEIKIIEIVRAVDTFLIKAVCPGCETEQMSSMTDFKCSDCDFIAKDFFFDVKGLSKRNIVATPDEKRRVRIGKRKIQQLFTMQEGLCAYCSRDLSEIEYHVDHVIPLVCGGTSKIDNLALSCPRCNLKASSKFFSNFYEKQKYINQRIS